MKKEKLMKRVIERAITGEEINKEREGVKSE